MSERATDKQQKGFWIPLEKIHEWRIALGQGDMRPRWEIEALLANEPISKPSAMADQWIPWSGGECPIKIEYRLRCGKVYTMRASDLEWGHDGKDPEGDILAYRICQYVKV